MNSGADLQNKRGLLRKRTNTQETVMASYTDGPRPAALSRLNFPCAMGRQRGPFQATSRLRRWRLPWAAYWASRPVSAERDDIAAMGEAESAPPPSFSENREPDLGDGSNLTAPPLTRRPRCGRLWLQVDGLLLVSPRQDYERGAQSSQSVTSRAGPPEEAQPKYQ